MRGDNAHTLDVPCTVELLLCACVTVCVVCMYLFVWVFPYILEVLMCMDMCSLFKPHLNLVCSVYDLLHKSLPLCCLLTSLLHTETEEP